MKLRQLEYFVAVAEAGSFRQAAQTLFVAQPSLSGQIAALEREIGGPLLVRQPRGVSLTVAGRVFLDEARRTLSAADRALRRGAEAIDGERGELRFATVLSIAAGLLPPALSAWRARRPLARAVLEEYRSSPDLEAAVASGMHDFGIGPQPTRRFEHLEPVGQEEFVIVLPEHDVLLEHAAVALAQLQERPWVLFTRSHGLSSLIDAVFAQHGIAPEASVKTSQTDVAVNLAVAGLGPTFVPRNVVPASTLPFTRPLEEPYTRQLFAFSDAPLAPLAHDFLTDVREACATANDR